MFHDTAIAPGGPICARHLVAGSRGCRRMDTRSRKPPSPHFVMVSILHRATIAALALEHRLPTIMEARVYVEAGGLMSYGPNVPDIFRRTATYEDKILKGTNPAELPVEQPATFELVINLKTAAQLGLTIPPSLLFE